MRKLLWIFFFCIPSISYASGVVHEYPKAPHRHASEVERVLAQAQFTLSHLEGHLDDKTVQSFLCTMRRSMPAFRGGGFLSVVSTKLGILLSRDATSIAVGLINPAACRFAPFSLPLFPKRHATLPLDKKGRPVSMNPVWNACITGQGLSVDLLRSNTDAFLHRQRRVRVLIPFSCRDYHRGNVDEWQYPDVPGATLLLDARGRLVQIVTGAETLSR